MEGYIMQRKFILWSLIFCMVGLVIVASDAPSEPVWYEKIVPMREVAIVLDHHILTSQEISTANPWKLHLLLIILKHVRGLSETFSSSLTDTIVCKIFGYHLPSMWPTFDYITPFDGKYTPTVAVYTSALFPNTKEQEEYKTSQDTALQLGNLAIKYIDKTILYTVIQKIVHAVSKRYLLAKLFTHLGPEWEALAKFDSVDVAMDFLPSSLKNIGKKVWSLPKFIKIEEVLTGIKIFVLLKIRYEIQQFKQSIKNHPPAHTITVNFKKDLPTLYRYNKFKNCLI